MQCKEKKSLRGDLILLLSCHDGLKVYIEGKLNLMLSFINGPRVWISMGNLDLILSCLDLSPNVLLKFKLDQISSMNECLGEHFIQTMT